MFSSSVTTRWSSPSSTPARPAARALCISSAHSFGTSVSTALSSPPATPPAAPTLPLTPCLVSISRNSAISSRRQSPSNALASSPAPQPRSPNLTAHSYALLAHVLAPSTRRLTPPASASFSNSASSRKCFLYRPRNGH